MAYQLFHLPKATQIDSSVRVTPGAKAYFYATTTTTPQDTYTTSALSVAHANPVVADANGVFPTIYLDATKIYKLTLTTSADVLIYTADPCNDQASTAPNIGAILWPIASIETDASVTPATFAYEWLDPRRYANVADWAATYAQVNTLGESYYSWYRGDHAQHQQLTNCIVGFRSYDDSQMTGTFGYRCTAFGAFALSLNNQSTLAGGSNTAVGYASMQDSVDTSGNTGCGTKTLASCTGVLSSHNGAFGNSTLEALVDGTQNNAFAYRCMYQLVTGNNNTGMGDVCLQGLLVGSGNISYGYQSTHSKIAGNFTHAIGYQAFFNETAALITAITKAPSAVVTISTGGTIHPFSLGQPVTFAGVGGMVEINNLTPIVTAVGGSTGAWTIQVQVNSTGFTTFTSGGYIAPHGNTGMGYRVAFNTNLRGGNTLMGADVGQTGELGYGNTLNGYQAGGALNCNTGSGDGAELNTLNGFWAGRQITSGAADTCFGQRAGENITTGSEDVCIGPNSGSGISTADRNAWVGSGNSVNLNGDLNSGLGFNAGVQASAQTYTNCTHLGANSTVTGANQLQLGDSGTTSYSFGAVQNRSDARDKADVRDTILGLAFIEKLRPVDHRWDLRADYSGEKDGSKKRKRYHHGLIAQDVKGVMDSLGLDFGGYQDHSIDGGQDVLSIGYTELIGPLIKAIQELSAKVSSLESERDAAQRQWIEHFR